MREVLLTKSKQSHHLRFKHDTLRTPVLLFCFHTQIAVKSQHVQQLHFRSYCRNNGQTCDLAMCHCYLRPRQKSSRLLSKQGSWSFPKVCSILASLILCKVLGRSFQHQVLIVTQLRMLETMRRRLSFSSVWVLGRSSMGVC